MHVKPVSDHGIDFLASDLVRSPGIHASDIYGDLFKHLEPSRYDYGDAPLNGVLMALGTAWEKHLEFLLLKAGYAIQRPEEFTTPEDGVAFSPDLIEFNGKTRLWELKLTSMALVNKFGAEVIQDGNVLPPKFNKYVAQMKLYAYWLGIHDGVLAIVSIYRPFKPEFRLIELMFTDRELDENYRMLMNHWGHMKAALTKGKTR